MSNASVYVTSRSVQSQEPLEWLAYLGRLQGVGWSLQGWFWRLGPLSFTLIIFWLVNRGHGVINGELLNAFITTTRC